MPDGGEVSYTFKELLASMRQEQREAHVELVAMVQGLKREVRDVAKRVEKLEVEKERRSAVGAYNTRALLAIIAIVTAVEGIPAMIFYLRGSP